MAYYVEMRLESDPDYNGNSDAEIAFKLRFTPLLEAAWLLFRANVSDLDALKPHLDVKIKTDCFFPIVYDYKTSTVLDDLYAFSGVTWSDLGGGQHEGTAVIQHPTDGRWTYFTDPNSHLPYRVNVYCHIYPGA